METFIRDNLWSESEKVCEEDGSLWLWAFQSLLKWPDDFVWLFSPVQRHHYPGDLWGIDCNGRLLMVETKLAGKPQDPFLNFIDLEHKWLLKAAVPFDPKTIEKHWRDLLQAERLFLENEAEAWKLGEREPKKQPGVVPYSSKREVVWHWRDLYFNKIAPLFQHGSDYENKATEYLRVYSEQNLPPQYIGLFTTFKGVAARLSSKGQEHLANLQQMVGKERVHLRTVEATRADREVVSFHSQVIVI